MWTQDHILFSLFRRCSGEMENFALSSFGFGKSGCLLPLIFHCSIQTSPTLHFVLLRSLKRLVERIASMEWGRAGAAPLISRRFAFPFVCMQLVTPNVAAIAVSTVMRMMGILLEVNELLL